MRTSGYCSVCCSGFLPSRFRRSSRPTHPQLSLRPAGFADLRLAVVSPFVDRRHGTERAIAELLERLAGDYGCEIHLYAQRVEDLRVSSAHLTRAGASEKSGIVVWHKVPSIPGPHVVRFLAWADCAASTADSAARLPTHAARSSRCSDATTPIMFGSGRVST